MLTHMGIYNNHHVTILQLITKGEILLHLPPPLHTPPHRPLSFQILDYKY